MNSKVLISAIIMLIAMVPISKGEPPSRTVEPLDDPQVHPIGFYRGMLPTISSGENLSKVYAGISSYTQFVPVRGRPTPFWNLSKDLEGDWGDLFVEDLIRGNGMFPLVHMSFFDKGLTLAIPPGMPEVTLSDPDWRNAYTQAAIDIVNASKPSYLSLGNEVNRWYEGFGNDGGDGFRHWVSLYESIYVKVKHLSPNTTVFCTFAREIVGQNREADMSVLSLFNSSTLDMLVLTSYPHSVLGINKVSDIPDDYYVSVFDHIPSKTIGFSEIAWPSYKAFGGVEAQSEFIKDATGRLTRDRGLNLHFIGWPWLTDVSAEDGLGLRYYNGTDKPSLKAWKMNNRPHYDPNNRTLTLSEDFGRYAYDLRRTFSDRTLGTP
jgi:hypothetical protein